jgi:hypothetical protein
MRTSSRARVVLLSMAWALAAATASAQEILYLRAGGSLSPDAPAAGAVTTTVSTRIPRGEDALLGSFTSAPLDHDVAIGNALGVVFLGTGRPGMDGCARVTMSLLRLTGAAKPEIATAELVTSIGPRRKVTDPVILSMTPSAALVVPAGDRLVFDVSVRNECGGDRTVSILYDSPGRPSRVELMMPGASTTTTTTVTSPTSTTTTTLPPTCLETATGLAAVSCRLEAMDALARGTSPASLGGAAFAGRLERRIDRALTFVRAAELVEATPRRLRKARRQLAHVTAQLARGRSTGRVAPEVGDPLGSLAQDATTRLASFVAGT